MTKIDINIIRREGLSRKCLFCERQVDQYYYDVSTNYEDGTVSCGRYRNICVDCYRALKKNFMECD